MTEHLKNPQDMTPLEIVRAVQMGQLSLQTAEVIAGESDE